jgi:hypothetical protein
MQTDASKRWAGNMFTALDKADGPRLEEAVMDFLHKNPTPSDSDWHAWAEKEGFDVPKAEAIAYALAGRFVAFMRGGLSKGVRPEGATDEAVQAGIAVEREHVKEDDEVARKIAYDHMAEHLGYYPALKEMEERLEEG